MYSKKSSTSNVSYDDCVQKTEVKSNLQWVFGGVQYNVRTHKLSLFQSDMKK